MVAQGPGPSNKSSTSLSTRSVATRRKRKEAIEEIYKESRGEFREINENWPLTLHFDEVDVEDTIGQGCLFLNFWVIFITGRIHLCC